jgi:hypothetical protein
MRDGLRGINVKYHRALGWLFVLQVAIIAACYLVNVDGPRERSGWLIFLSFFVWPLIAAWPARCGWLLRGVMTNALAIIFTIAYFTYFRGGVADWLLLSTILAFGMVSGMAAGGLVERWRNKRARLNPPRTLPLLTAPVSSLTDDYFSSESVSSYRV